MHHRHDPVKNRQARRRGEHFNFIVLFRLIKWVNIKIVDCFSLFRPKSNASLDSVDPTTHANSSSSGQNGSNQQASINETHNFLPAHLKYTTPDQNSNPIPPYMPIQGVRRNGNVHSDKKKKPKDNRCTHQ